MVDLTDQEFWVLGVLLKLWRHNPRPGNRELLLSALAEGTRDTDERNLNTIAGRLERKGVVRVTRTVKAHRRGKPLKTYHPGADVDATAQAHLAKLLGRVPDHPEMLAFLFELAAKRLFDIDPHALTRRLERLRDELPESSAASASSA